MLICVLSILLALIAVASADGLIQDTITVSGYLTAQPEVTQVGPYLIIEGMKAEGTVVSSQLFEGADFSIDNETAMIDLRTLEGVNWGRITITKCDDESEDEPKAEGKVEGKVHIWFRGQTFDLNPETMEAA